MLCGVDQFTNVLTSSPSASSGNASDSTTEPFTLDLFQPLSGVPAGAPTLDSKRPAAAGLTGGSASTMTAAASGARAAPALAAAAAGDHAYTCHVCSKSFKRETNLMFHMSTHRPRVVDEETGVGADGKWDSPTQCPGCTRVFATKYQAKKHFLRRHFAGNKKYVCPVCTTKAFTVKEDFSMHVKSCGRVFTCSCGLRLRSRATLKRHCKFNGHTPHSWSGTPSAEAIANVELAALARTAPTEVVERAIEEAAAEAMRVCGAPAGSAGATGAPSAAAAAAHQSTAGGGGSAGPSSAADAADAAVDAALGGAWAPHPNPGFPATARHTGGAEAASFRDNGAPAQATHQLAGAGASFLASPAAGGPLPSPSPCPLSTDAPSAAAIAAVAAAHAYAITGPPPPPSASVPVSLPLPMVDFELMQALLDAPNEDELMAALGAALE